MSRDEEIAANIAHQGEVLERRIAEEKTKKAAERARQERADRIAQMQEKLLAGQLRELDERKREAELRPDLRGEPEPVAEQPRVDAPVSDPAPDPIAALGCAVYGCLTWDEEKADRNRVLCEYRAAWKGAGEEKSYESIAQECFRKWNHRSHIDKWLGMDSYYDQHDARIRKVLSRRPLEPSA